MLFISTDRGKRKVKISPLLFLIKLFVYITLENCNKIKGKKQAAPNPNIA